MDEPHRRDFKAGADLSILRGNTALTEIRKSFTKKILDSIEVSWLESSLGKQECLSFTQILCK